MTQERKRHQILVVGGDFDLTQQVKQALSGNGFVVQTAYSHRDAIFALENEVYNAALVDGAMFDRISGEPTISALKRFQHVPMILFSGNGKPPIDSSPVQMVIGGLDKRTLANSVRGVLGIEQQAAQTKVAARVDEVQTLFALGRTLTEVLELSEVLNRIVEAARNLAHAEEGMILLPDDEIGQLYLRAKVGIDEAAARNFRIKTDDTLAGHVFSSGKPALIGAQGPQKVKTEYFVNSLLYVPILLKNKTIGVLGVNNKNTEDVFDEHQQELLMNLASYAAIAIENARIHEESLRKTRELQSLVEASQVVNSSVSLDRTLPNICEQLVQLLRVNWSEIYDWHHESNQLRLLARYQHTLWRPGRGPTIKLERYPALRAALEENRYLQVSRDGQRSEETDSLERGGIHTLLTLPIQTDKQVLGVVRAFFIHPPAKSFDTETMQRLHTLGLESLMMVAGATSQYASQHVFRLAEEINRVVEADWCEMALLSPNSQSLNVQASVGRGVWLESPRPAIDLNSFPDLQEAVVNQIPINQRSDGEKLGKGARAVLDVASSQILLGLPLVQRGQAQGLVLFGDARSSRLFTDREIDLGRAIVGQAATALENAHLVHDLELSLEELKDTHDRLIQTARLSAMGELAAAVAHQINNPLTTILVDTEMMIQDEPENSRNFRSLLAISRAGKRAAGVVRRLLATARPTEENAPIEAIDVVDTIEGILSLVRQHIERDHIKVIGHWPEIKLPPVYTVQGQLDDIWLNMLLNAHDALIGRPDAEVGIEVLYQPDDLYIDVVIWDNGPGIPEHIQSEIFKPFFTTKPVGQGTGLGLHISRQVVERVGGSITLQSAANKGTRFIVRLPVKKGEK